MSWLRRLLNRHRLRQAMNWFSRLDLKKRLVVAAVAALSLIGAGALTELGGDVYREVFDLFRSPDDPKPSPSPSATKDAIERYVEETEQANLWVDPPLVLPGSVEFLEENLAHFMPGPHNIFELPDSKRAELSSLTQKAALWDGRLFITQGVVTRWNPLTSDRKYGFLILQLAPPGSKVPSAYCRLGAPVRMGYRPGDLLSVTGIVLAAGRTQLSGGTFADISYLACSGAIRLLRGGGFLAHGTSLELPLPMGAELRDSHERCIGNVLRRRIYLQVPEVSPQDVRFYFIAVANDRRIKWDITNTAVRGLDAPPLAIRHHRLAAEGTLHFDGSVERSTGVDLKVAYSIQGGC